MNKRLQKMIDENKIPNKGGVFIDAYNQSINEDIAGTITTRVDASNMIFIPELCNTKEKKYNPTKVSIGTPPKSSFTDKLGGGISRCVKTDDSLATLVMEDIIKIGNYSPSGHNASVVVSGDGISPTVMENHGTVTAVMVEKTKTDTPICLNSKVDGKQPSVADRVYSPDGISVAITSGWLQNIAEPKVTQIGNIVNDTDRKFKNPQCGRVYSENGLAPTINTCQGGQREPKILTIPDATKQGYIPSYRIRKLTPRECFRLMGVREPYIDKIQNANISNSQQYKLAGNSIVVDNLFHIFRKLLIETDTQEQEQLSLF